MSNLLDDLDSVSPTLPDNDMLSTDSYLYNMNYMNTNYSNNDNTYNNIIDNTYTTALNSNDTNSVSDTLVLTSPQFGSVADTSSITDSIQYPQQQQQSDQSTDIYTQPTERRLLLGGACTSCHNSKVKCSGDRPCSRCVQTGKQCTDRVCKRKQHSISINTNTSHKQNYNKINNNNNNSKNNNDNNNNNNNNSNMTKYTSYNGLQQTNSYTGDKQLRSNNHNNNNNNINYNNDSLILYQSNNLHYDMPLTSIYDEQTLVSNIVLECLLRHIDDMSTRLLDSRGSFTLNLILTNASHSLQPQQYDTLIQTCLQNVHEYNSRLEQHKSINNKIIHRRFITDYSLCPVHCRVTDPNDIQPEVATIIFNNLYLTSIKYNNVYNNNNNHNIINNINNHNQHKPSYNAIQYDYTHTSRKCWSSTSRNNNLRDTHINVDVPMNVMDCLECLSDSDIIKLEQSASVNDTFERLFGYSQAEIKYMFNTLGGYAFWRLFNYLQQSQQLNPINNNNNIHSATRSIVYDIENIFNLQHNAIVCGHLSYSTKTTIVTKSGQLLPCVLNCKIMPSSDGMINAIAYSFTPIPNTRHNIT